MADRAPLISALPASPGHGATHSSSFNFSSPERRKKRIAALSIAIAGLLLLGTIVGVVLLAARGDGAGDVGAGDAEVDPGPRAAHCPFIGNSWRLPITVFPTAYSVELDLTALTGNGSSLALQNLAVEGLLVVGITNVASASSTTYPAKRRREVVTTSGVSCIVINVGETVSVDLSSIYLTAGPASLRPLEATLHRNLEQLVLQFDSNDLEGVWPGSHGSIGGQAELRMSFVTRVVTAAEYSAHALFASEVEPNIVVYSTQNQPTWARFVFPCFDEPGLKAIWQFTIKARTHSSRGIPLLALSNTEVLAHRVNASLGVQVVEFLPTPVPMSSYLTAIALGDFRSVSTVAPVLRQNVTFAVMLAPPVPVESGVFGLDYSIAALQTLSVLLNASFPFTKLDSVAIPERGGAMENYGLVLYAYSSLLASDSSTFVQNQTALNVITHELAHQWFGNSVTCRWWSETYLNEGFARYYGYRIADVLEPTWDSWNTHFIPRRLLPCLVADASGLANAVVKSSSHASNAAALNFDLGSTFDTTTYNKGGALNRYFERYCGTLQWDIAMRYYIQRHEYQSVVLADLFAVVEKQVPGMAEKMGPWLTQRGFPAVSLRLDMEDNITATFIQTPIGQRTAASDVLWWIWLPMEHFLSNGTVLHYGVEFTTAEHTTQLPLAVGRDDVLVINPGFVTYTIVEYPSFLESRILSLSWWSVLAESERLVFSTSAFLRMDTCHGVQQLPQATALSITSLVEQSGSNSSIAIWSNVLNGWIERFPAVRRSSNFKTSFKPIVSAAAGAAVSLSQAFGSNTTSYNAIRSSAAWAAVLFGNQPSIAAADELFQSTFGPNSTENSIPVFARPAVYYVAIHYAPDNATEFHRFNMLEQLWNSSRADTRPVLRTGLAAPRQLVLCNRALQLFMSPAAVVTSVLSRCADVVFMHRINDVCAEPAWDLLLLAATLDEVLREGVTTSNPALPSVFAETLANEVVSADEGFRFNSWLERNSKLFEISLIDKLKVASSARVRAAECLA